jgi:chromodomain-helicase-DNA-binding protein 4
VVCESHYLGFPLITIRPPSVSIKCPVATHWQCLGSIKQNEIIKATQARDRIKWLKEREGQDVDVAKDGPRKRPGLEYDQTTEFICG